MPTSSSKRMNIASITRHGCHRIRCAVAFAIRKFSLADIRECLDESSGAAVYPCRGINAVMGDISGNPITPEFYGGCVNTGLRQTKHSREKRQGANSQGEQDKPR
jgi:hypothetical protein